MRGRIFRGNNRTRGNEDEGREGEGSIGMADTKVCQEHPKVLRIGKLLLLIHTRLCVYCETIA